VVCIDSPDFTHRIAQRLHRTNPEIATVNYVAPQVWASRQYRARNMARYFDLVLALLPFEAPFFESHGLHARFVGHPVVERAARMVGGEALRERLNIPRNAKVIAILPGSRMSEIRPLLPIFRDTIARVHTQIPNVTCILPAVSHLAPLVRKLAQGWSVPLHIVETEADKFAAFGAADAALAASGTVTTELALAGTPMVVAYRVGWVTAMLVRPFIHVRYVTLINLLLERQAVPEFIQSRCRARLLAPSLLRLLQDKEARELQEQDLAEAVHLLGRDEEAPSLRAARALLEFVRERRAADQRRPSGT
jgi:lipid-A-disaccharide synthase